MDKTRGPPFSLTQSLLCFTGGGIGVVSLFCIVPPTLAYVKRREREGELTTGGTSVLLDDKERQEGSIFSKLMDLRSQPLSLVPGGNFVLFLIGVVGVSVMGETIMGLAL